MSDAAHRRPRRERPREGRVAAITGACTYLGVELLRRLAAITKNPADKVAHVLREASILADGLHDIDGAIERYEQIYKTLDPKSRVDC